MSESEGFFARLKKTLKRKFGRKVEVKKVTPPPATPSRPVYRAPRIVIVTPTGEVELNSEGDVIKVRGTTSEIKEAVNDAEKGGRRRQRKTRKNRRRA